MSNPYGGNPYGNPGDQNPYGGPPYGGGTPPPAYGAPQPAGTDGVSIASFVLSLLCCGPIGLILGFVGLSRTKNGQRKGRGFAIAGIIIGILGIIGGVVAGVVIALAAKDVVSINDLETGQCINADGLKASESGSVGLITKVDCTDSHDGEVIATKTLSADEASNYNFGDESQINDICISMLDPGVAARLNDPKYFINALTESKTPSSGDQVSCVITLANGDDLTEDLL